MSSGIWTGFVIPASWTESESSLLHLPQPLFLPLYSPHDVRKIKFEEYLAASEPTVQERWMGPSFLF